MIKLNEEGREHVYSDYWGLLHPEIIKAAKKRFESGFRYDAVEAAVMALRDRVKELIIENAGSDFYLRREDRDLDGVELMQFAFKLSKPAIAFNNLKTQSERNIQNGYSQIFSGVMLAIRNPKAHDDIELEPIEATRILIFLSHLFTQLDKSVNYKELPKKMLMLEFIRSVTWENVEQKKEEWQRFTIKSKEAFLPRALNLLVQKEYDASRLDPLSYIIKSSESDAELIKLLEPVIDYISSNTLKSYHKTKILKFIDTFVDLDPIKQILIKKYLRRLIEDFINSESFEMANTTASLLRYFINSLSEEDKLAITVAFIKNDQIHNAFNPTRYLRELLLNTKDRLDNKQQIELDKFLNIES